jgi:hypothetical protein
MLQVVTLLAETKRTSHSGCINGVDRLVLGFGAL